MSASGNGPLLIGHPRANAVGMPFEGPSSLPPLTLDDDSGILARLRRRKLSFGLTFGAVIGLVAAAYFLVPRTYRATASVLVSSADVVLGTPQSPATQQNIGDPADLESQTAVLSSTLLLQQVLAQPRVRQALLQECEMNPAPPFVEAVKVAIGLGPAETCADMVDDTASEIATLQNRYVVSASGRSRVLDVSFGSPSPQIAQLMANALVQAYLGLRTREKLEPRDAAIKWLRTEISRLGTSLKTSERTIEAFLHNHGLVRGQTAPIASEQLTALSQQLAGAEADMAMAAGRLGQAGRAGGNTRDALDSRSVSDLKQQLATIEGAIAQMSAQHGQAYPGLSSLEQQRAAVRQELGAETRRVTSSVGHDYRAAAGRVASLRRQVEALKKEVTLGDDATTQIATLQRDADVERELYLDLTKRVNELEAERRLVVGDARLVNLAELPEKLFFPKKVTFGLTGLLLATALATVVALLRDRADRTVRETSSLQVASGVRVLAHIPRVRRAGSGDRLAQHIGEPSAFQEAIRALYAECMLVDGEPLRTVLITSSHAGEGKTFVTLALAHFAAAAGKRVLVIECDLRRPTIAKTLAITPDQGVSEYLRDKIRLEEIVRSSSMEGLDIILAGKPAINSTELLNDRRIRQMLEWAAGQYDLVLIDTPPSQVLRDVRILARHVDGVLYCAQWGQSRMSDVLEGVHQIQADGGRVIGLVLDRVETDEYRLYNPHASVPVAYLAHGAA